MLVKTNERPGWVVWFAVEREDVFHVVDELGVLLWRDHPLFGWVRLELVFLRTWRPVSWETDSCSISSRTTSSSARRRSVQRGRPSGGSLVARAMRWASSSPSSLRSYSRSGLRR